MPQAIKDKQIIFIPINKDLLIPAAASFPMMKSVNMSVYWVIVKMWQQDQLTAKQLFVDAAVTLKQHLLKIFAPEVQIFYRKLWVCFCECTLDYPVKQMENASVVACIQHIM